MARPAEYENLLRAGDFKEAVVSDDSIAQLLYNADEMLTGASSPMPDAVRFLLGYEGMFSVVLAVLEFHGVRPGDAGGHRTTAIQRVAADLKLSATRRSALARLHEARNRIADRRPLPPATRADANAMRAVLEEMLAAATKLINE